MTHHTDAERAAYERELIDNHYYVPSDFFFKDGFYGGDDDYIQFGWDLWQAARRAPAAPVPQGWKLVPIELLERIQESLGSFVSDQGWSQPDMDTADALDGLLAAAPQPPDPQVTPEMIEAALEAYMPFGDMHLAIQAALAAAPQPPANET